jgi:hypothetical protein
MGVVLLKRWVVFAGVLFAAAFGMASAAMSAQRVALVIGNSDYDNVSVLPNTINDATAVSQSLERLGFEVVFRTDLNKALLEQTLADFSDRASGADQAVFYYAGHGMELEGENYLIPIDAGLKSDNRVKFETVSLSDILSSVEGVKGIKLILLDACRNNPFVTTMKSLRTDRSIGRGLARVEPKPGILVSYAAAAGTTAADSEGASSHSPYTEALLEFIEQPGLELNLMFRMVGDRVQERTEGRQTPFEYGRLPGINIYLKPPVEVELQPIVVNACEDAAVHWSAIEDKDDPALFEDHLMRFGGCAFATLAKATLKRLGNPPAGDGLAVEAKATAESKTQEVAALDPALAAEMAADPVDDSLMVRQVQEQLSRAGCLAGRADGHWGPASSAALRSYRALRTLPEGLDTPSAALLAALQGATERICPIECKVTEMLEGGQCIAKACPAGRQLSASGACIRIKSKAADISRKATQPERKAVQRRTTTLPRASAQIEMETRKARPVETQALRRCNSVREAELKLKCRPM